MKSHADAPAFLPEAESTPWQREQMAAWRIRFCRDRHEQQILIWKERQSFTRDYASLSSLADWCSREYGSVARNEQLRAQACHELMGAVLAGEFNRAARCCVAYLPDGATDSSKPLRLRLQLEQLRRWQHSNHSEVEQRLQILSNCWAPRAICLLWFQARDIRPPPWLEPPGATRETSTALATPSKKVGGPKNVGGRPPKWDWAAFDREMMRLANTPDGLPKRSVLMRHMLDWCFREWGDTPAESAVRERIAARDPT